MRKCCFRSPQQHGRVRWRGPDLLSGLFLAILMSGCGGGDPEPLPVVVAPPPPSPAPAAQPPAAAPRPRPVPANRSRPAAPADPAAEVDAPNLYVMGEPVANFDATLPELRVGEARYDAWQPLAGVSSRSFVAQRLQPDAVPRRRNPSIELPTGFVAIESAGLNAQGIPLRIRCEKDGTEMALVPAGAFLRGTGDGPPHAGPAHTAYVDPFYMDIHEVTLARYQQFRTENLSRRPQQPLNQFDPPQYPAVGINWRDALNYCKWTGKDLPTEAEWEKAGRGEHGFNYPWGNGRALWSEPRRPGQIDVVGSHANDRSQFGIYDLAGSAREWCSDWYADDAFRQARTPDGSPVVNPQGPDRPSEPNERVVKGAGSEGWHLWSRSGLNMKDSQYDVGFRCVLRIKLPETPTPTAAEL